MPKTVEIALEPLMAEAFAPFGQIVGEPWTLPAFKVPHLEAWRLEFTVDGPTELMYVRYVHEPYRCSRLERHAGVSQAFVPLGDAPSVMVVAAPTEADPPAPDQVRAFFVPGDRGILLWRGTWHALTRFPVRPEGGAFLMVTGAVTQRELEQELAGAARPTLTHVVDYGERAGIGFQVTDPHRLLPS